MDITTEVLIVGIPLFLLVLACVFLYIKKNRAYSKLYNKYKDVIDIDVEVEKTKLSLDKLKIEFDSLDSNFKSKSDTLNAEYKQKRDVYEKLLREVDILEENLELTTYGLYKPHYEYDTSEEYKEQLEQVRTKQKDLIKYKTAAVCGTEWEVGGSKREGQKMTNQYLKLMLRAFNNESDSAVLKVKWNNVIKMEQRLQKAFDAVNKLGSTQNIDVTDKYFNLKLQELRLTHEYQEKLHEEKEEQRQIREQMREEEKVTREIEKAQKEAEAEEKRYQQALEKAQDEIKKAKGKELDDLNKKLIELESKLKEAQQDKERVVSRAQLTKSGHIYIISNIGSFGDNIIKIGMTRRLEPKDRVKELGDASVPFEFDIHAMIFSENAPELESTLHKEFNHKRVNLVNTRKEFFNVSLDEIAKVVEKRNNKIEITKLAEAREYRESLTIKEQKSNEKSLEEKVEEKFPTSL